MSTKQIAIAALGVVAGGALLYFMSREESVKFDPKVHTREAFLQLLEELNLEYVCIYVRNYNMLLKMKENNELKAEILKGAEAESEHDINNKTASVIKQNPGFTLEHVTQFLKENSNDPVVKGYATKLEELRDNVFNKMLITDLCYKKDLPPKMTKEVYIQIYRKIFAALRHDMYMKVTALKKESNSNAVSEENFAKVQEEVWARFENVREDIYNLMMDENVTSKVAKKVMQRAYVTYGAISSQSTDEKGNTIRSRWADQVTDVAQKHSSYMRDMSEGKFYANIEIDPRDSKDADEKVALTVQANPNIKRRKTMLSDAKTHVTQMSPAADKYVKKMVALAKKIHAEVEEKKKIALEQTESKEEEATVPLIELEVTEQQVDQLEQVAAE